jgi:hypothetical protein
MIGYKNSPGSNQRLTKSMVNLLTSSRGGDRVAIGRTIETVRMIKKGDDKND